MEGARSPKAYLPMAKKWYSDSMEWGSPSTERTRWDGRTKRGSHEGDETVGPRRGIQLYKRAGGEYLACVSNTKKNGGTRLIHDLREINQHIRAPHFTLKGARDAASVVTNSEWLCTLDLKRGYQHVFMEVEAWKYLGAWIGRETVVSDVLPFGLSLSPYVFTRSTSWVVGVIRRKTGLKVGVYIDDFLLGANSKQ